MTNYKFRLPLNPAQALPATRDAIAPSVTALPAAKETKVHPSKSTGSENASIFFVGTATTILEWSGIRIMTDPNFLHDGDHVHLGPGVSATRRTNPAIPELSDLPSIDVVLLSHYHGDHFDEKVEGSLRRDLPIITTPHAHDHLSNKPGEEKFTAVHPLDHHEAGLITIPNSKAAIRVTGMPGKHVPPGPGNVIEALNDFLGAVPPTNGWIVELGHQSESGDFSTGYRIYISGDTMLIPELKEVAEKYRKDGIDLMLVHLGGTTIPGPRMPLMMVTMDAKMGVELIRMINPDLTIPIHYDDYDVFLSGLDEFKKEVSAAGLDGKVVYLDRGDAFKFDVKVSS